MTILLESKNIERIIIESPNYATCKVYIAFMVAEAEGKLLTIPQVSRKLGMAYQTAWNATKWLLENDFMEREGSDVLIK